MTRPDVLLFQLAAMCDQMDVNERTRGGPWAGVAAELRCAARHVLRVEAERDRYIEALEKIDGGDRPCRDEATLRRWAFEAIMGRDS